MLLGTGRTLSFEYDNLLRVSRRNVSGVYQHRRNYMGTGAANRQANQIQYFVYASADGADTKLNYRYDSMLVVTSVKSTGLLVRIRLHFTAVTSMIHLAGW